VYVFLPFKLLHNKSVEGEAAQARSRETIIDRR
jgi:hypothetical protein